MNTIQTRVKICCISSIEEAQLAIDHDASALGLVSHMPSGPGVIEEDLIVKIVSSVPAGIDTFLLTSALRTEEIIDQQRKTGVNTLQLVDWVGPGVLQGLREALPSIALVQVIHIQGPESLEEALAAAPFVDALLLDSGNPTLEVKQLGGTGRVHDWEISRTIRDHVDVPVYLAGGLNAENVAEAVARVQPYGVDVCSGVRTDGRLDAGRLDRFFEVISGTVLP